MKVVKWIVSVFLIMSGFGSLISGEILSGLLIGILGVIVMPPVSENLKAKFDFWQKNYIRYLSYFILFVIASLFIDKQNLVSENQDTKTYSVEDKKTSDVLYSDYQGNVKNIVSAFNKEEVEGREKMIERLKSTNTYSKLHTDKIVTAEYVPVLNAISNGITFITPEGFSIDETLTKRIEKEKDSEDKITFAISSIALAQEQKGGLTNELIEIFERYRKKYNYYGNESIVFNGKGKEQEQIEYPYDFSSIFGLINPKNKKVLNAIYEAKDKGISIWNSEEADYAYPYLATSSDYNNYLKKVYPKSPYILNFDYALTARELHQAYSDNEISADDKYKGKKLAVTGVISDIGNDILDDSYITLKTSDFLGSVQCYMKKEIVGKLRKGQKVTVIGKCRGLMVNVLIEDCKLIEK